MQLPSSVPSPRTESLTCTPPPPSPSHPLPLLPLTSPTAAAIQFDDLPRLDTLKSYKGFRFPGIVDWSIVQKSARSDTPYDKGITSAPNGLLSVFHWQTWFGAETAFTFDLISFNLTALTAHTPAPSNPYLVVKIVGYRDGEDKAAGKKEIKVRNAAGKGGAVNVVFGKEWRALDRVGIQAEEMETPGYVPKPWDISPGFVLDDVVYAKRKFC